MNVLKYYSAKCIININSFRLYGLSIKFVLAKCHVYNLVKILVTGNEFFGGQIVTVLY